MSGVVLLDLKKAFDAADHNVLLKKLTIYLKDSCLENLLNRIFITTHRTLLHSSEDSVKFGVL